MLVVHNRTDGGEELASEYKTCAFANGEAKIPADQHRGRRKSQTKKPNFCPILSKKGRGRWGEGGKGRDCFGNKSFSVFGQFHGEVGVVLSGWDGWRCSRGDATNSWIVPVMPVLQYRQPFPTSKIYGNRGPTSAQICSIGTCF